MATFKLNVELYILTLNYKLKSLFNVGAKLYLNYTDFYL